MPGRSVQKIAFLGAFVGLTAWATAARCEAVNASPAPNSGRATAPEDQLRVVVDEAIERTTRRYLETNSHTPWQIMHGLLALRGDYVIKSGGEKVNAIDWISNQARYRGDYWFETTEDGARAHPYSVPYAFEGHVNQFLAILTMSNLPMDHEFQVSGGHVVTMADMVRHAQLHVNTKEETTWTLWFLTHYLEPDAEWTSADGEAWSMDRLVRIQSRSPVTRAPCGGTHQLFALSYSRNLYLQKFGRLRGAWLEADQKLKSHIAAAQNLQNQDGSFSSEFFKGRGYSDDFGERIKSSGHMLEWLMMALPERDLQQSWVRRGVQSVADDLTQNSRKPADCGPLYHALHGLVLYRERTTPKPVLAERVPEEQPPQIERRGSRFVLELLPDEGTLPVKPADVSTEQPAPVDTAETAEDPVVIEEDALPPPPPSRRPTTVVEDADVVPIDLEEARPADSPDSPEVDALASPPLPPRN